ncbi:RAD61 (YDR014W) [Zygosaccharomyces parabailii]|nr:RAD61 (YDR014W) [Zygosaccharomyces parabailii]
MKVYGKRSSSIGIYASHSDRSEVELSDYESEPDVKQGKASKASQEIQDSTVESPMPLGICTDDQLNSLSDAKVNSSASSSVDSSSANLKAFDFLDHTEQLTKRRKTLHQASTDPNDEDTATKLVNDNPFNKTIDDLNKFISSLKNGDESSIQETFKEELEKSLELKSSGGSGKLTYGHSRTILLSKDEEEGLEADEDELKLSKEQKDDSQTYHINELKNMGDNLKYQDDLELLMEGSPTKMSRPHFTSNLLSIALTMNADEDFCCYVNEHQAAEMWRWFFSQRDWNDPVLILMQGWLSTIFHLPADDLPPFFQSFVAASYSNNVLPHSSTVVTKIAQLNYKDFLQRTRNSTSQEYALKLCLQYPGLLSSKELVESIVDNFVKKVKSPKSSFPVIERIVSSALVQGVAWAPTLFNRLVTLLPAYCNDDSLIKCLILLTNERAMPKQNLAFKISMEFVLNHFWPLRLEQTDILILHLGLCLNIIGSSKEMSVDDSQWAQANHTFSKLSHCHEIDCFLPNMFYLNFAYMTVSSNKKLQSRTRTKLAEKLNSFAEEARHYNKSIPDKIKYVSEKL